MTFLPNLVQVSKFQRICFRIRPIGQGRFFVFSLFLQTGSGELSGIVFEMLFFKTNPGA